MSFGDIILEVALAASAIVGLIVFASNRRRTPNQAFVLLALTAAAWMGSVLEAFHSHTPARAVVWIRSATFTGGFLPVAITILHVSVVHPSLSLLQVARRIRHWLVIYALIALYSASPLYLVGAEIPPHGVPNARYGSLSWVFPIYVLGGLICTFISVWRDHRKAHGVTAVELEYVLAGLGCIFGAGIFAGVVPLITRNSQFVPFAPLWFVAMNGSIAYGIAIRRILSVGTLLRRALSYLLLVVYLICIYAVAWWGAAWLLRTFSLNARFAAPLFGTLCVAMSVGGARSFLQAFVRKLFINLNQLDLRSTLRSADRLLTQVTTTGELLEDFLRLLGRAAGTDLVTVCLFDEKSARQVWHTREAGPADPGLFEVFRNLPAPLAVSTISREESSAVEREAALRLRAMSGALAIPIKNGRSEMGVVILGEKLSGRMYDNEEQESVQLLTNRLAVALVNARLYTEQRQSKEYLESLLGALPGGVIACDPHGVVTVCNAEAERLLRRPAAVVIAKPVTDLPLLFATAFEKTLSAGTGLEDQNDMLDTGETAVPVRYRSLVFRDRSQGAFLVFRDLTQIKQLEQAQLLRNVHDRAIARLSQRALEGRNLSVLMEESVAMVAEVLEAEFCLVLQLVHDGSEFVVQAGTGWKDGCVGHARMTSCKTFHAGFALLSDSPVIVDDFETETRFGAPELLLEHGVISGVCVSIHGRAKPYGVLGAYLGKRRIFSSDDVYLLQSVANVLALTLVRTELENEMLDIISREQRSFGQDLHDSLCQELVGIHFKTGAFAAKLTDEKQKSEAKQICEYMRGALNHARMLAKGLVPVHVETNGLMSALDELATNISALFNITCRFECARPVMVEDFGVSTHLYRIAQEAISNAIRHGGAKCVIVRLDQVEDEGVLTIHEDGIGFSPDDANKNGMGLHTMAYRAAAIGAKLVIEGAPGEGTIVTCTFSVE